MDFARGREADLSLDLFGLEGIMGPPSAKRHAPAHHDSDRTPKKPKSDGPSPRGRGQEKAAAASEEASRTPTGEDPWVGRQVRLKRGKYEGRSATVLGKTSKKYQVQVEGVPYQLEFYSTMFVMPEHYKAPKNRGRKKKVETETSADVLGFGITISQDDIPPEILGGVITGSVPSPVTRTRSQDRML